MASLEDIVSLIFMHIAKWASSKVGFGCIRVQGILHNWEVSLLCGSPKVRTKRHWVPTPIDSFKFNVDGAAREKSRLIGIGGVFRNSEGWFWLYSP